MYHSLRDFGDRFFSITLVTAHQWESLTSIHHYGSAFAFDSSFIYYFTSIAHELYAYCEYNERKYYHSETGNGNF